MDTHPPLRQARRDPRRGTAAGLRRPAALLAATVVAGACAPRPLLERAIRARGGPLENVVREVESRVEAGFPGTWRWRTAFMVPDRWAWTVVTAAEPHHYLFDGHTVRAFVGTSEVSTDTGPSAPLRSHARFFSVVNLDALRLPGASLRELSPGELPPGAAAGLAVVLAGDGARYRLGFDERALLVWATGPVALPPLGAGEIEARFGDFRRVRGRVVPLRTAWTFAGAPLAIERALAVCPNARGLDLASFQAAGRVPACARR